MRSSGVLSVLTVVCASVIGLAAGEAVFRARHPEFTRGAILDRILRERYSWRRPDTPVSSHF